GERGRDRDADVRRHRQYVGTHRALLRPPGPAEPVPARRHATPAGGHRRPAAGTTVTKRVVAGSQVQETKERRWISATPRKRPNTAPTRARGCRTTAWCPSRAPAC